MFLLARRGLASRFAIVAIVLLCVVSSPCHAEEIPTRRNDVASIDGIGFISDQRLGKRAEKQVNQLIRDEKATACKDLFEQLTEVQDKPYRLALPTHAKKRQALPRFYSNACKSVVLIMISRKHNDHWHINPGATGFAIANDGTIVTNFHVVPDNDEFMFAMTSDGRVHNVVEVLSGNRNADIAIMRLDIDSIDPLPLKVGLPTGSPVRVISHPRGRFYSLSQGIVSRRYERPAVKPRGEESSEVAPGVQTRWVTISAEFGSGSSGAPVFDQKGNVIAMATSTSGVEAGEGPRRTTQMVFRDCVPAEVILSLTESPER